MSEPETVTKRDAFPPREPTSRSISISVAVELALYACVTAVFLLIRLPLYSEPGVHLGWHSDAAIIGLMGKRMLAGTEFPVFFWGQSYMGTMTAILEAAVGLVLRTAGLAGGAGPLALRIAMALEVFAGLAFMAAGLRLSFGRRTALITALWLAIGPRFLGQLTIAEGGAGMALLLGGIVFWLAVRRLDPETGTLSGGWFLFGLLAGFIWWMNQTAVFVIAAVGLTLVLNSETWHRLRPRFRLIDRLLAHDTRLGWNPLDVPALMAIRLINAALVVLAVLGILRSFGLDVPAFFLHDPLIEPIGLFLAAQIVIDRLAGGDALRILVRSMSWTTARRAALFLAGAVLGYLPVILGDLLDWFPDDYGLSVPLMSPALLVSHAVHVLRVDLWRLLGTDHGPLSFAFGMVLVALLLFGAWRERTSVARFLLLRSGGHGRRSIAGGTILFCSIFYFFSSRTKDEPVRYIVTALPMLYAFAIAEGFWIWDRAAGILRRAAVAVALLLGAFALLGPQLAQTREVVTARQEQRHGLGSRLDPRPIIQRIESEGYSICYADYWTAYKLQWVSDERIRFIPYHDFDRTRDVSRALRAIPGRKCLVTPDGTVEEFHPGDESVSRAAAERLRRMR